MAGMEEEEHEVYGGDIPEMEADVDMSIADDDAVKVKELDEMKKRLKEMEEEGAALREMQAKVEKEMGGASAALQDPAATAATQATKEEVDNLSIFVGNDDSNFSIAPDFFFFTVNYHGSFLFINKLSLSAVGSV